VQIRHFNPETIHRYPFVRLRPKQTPHARRLARFAVFGPGNQPLVRKLLLQHGAAWLLWWTSLFWLWMLLVGEWNRIEWIAGACAATLGASGAELARALSGLRVRIPLRDLRSAWTVPAMVVFDFAIVVGALLASPVRRSLVEGRFLARDFAGGGRGLAPERFGRRAWRGYAANVGPNAYVVDLDDETVLLHDLVPYGRSEGARVNAFT
jgi:hypothetical protein